MSDPGHAAKCEDSDDPVVLPRGTADRMDNPTAEMHDGFGARIDSIVRGLGRKTAAIFPWFEAPLSVCRGLYADAYVRAVRSKYNLTHAAPIEPLRILRIDPDRISTVAAPTGLSRFRRAGIVMDGEWDRTNIHFTDTDVYRAFESRFCEGKSWEETAFFRRVVDEIADGASPWDCESRDEFEHRCRQLDQLYDSIREEGFRTQEELARSETDDPLEKSRGTLTARILNDEVAVDIGRDGTFLYSDGRNRLAIAKILDIDTIPVVVLRRHEQWAVLRDAIVAYADRSGRETPFSGHPDIEPYLE